MGQKRRGHTKTDPTPRKRITHRPSLEGGQKQSVHTKSVRPRKVITLQPRRRLGLGVVDREVDLDAVLGLRTFFVMSPQILPDRLLIDAELLADSAAGLLAILQHFGVA